MRTLLFLGLVFLPFSISAEDYASLLQKGRTARIEKRYAEAVDLLAQARTAAGELSDDLKAAAIGDIANQQGMLALDQQQSEDAVKLFSDALTAYESLGEQRLKDQIVVLVNLTVAHRQQKHFAESIATLTRRQQLMEQAKFPPAEIVDNLDGIAGNYISLKDYVKADDVLERMQQLQAATHGGNSSEVAKIIDTRAGVAVDGKVVEKEEQLWKQALAVRTALHGGRAHEVMVDSHFRLAKFYVRQKRFDEALMEFQTADVQAARRYGRDSITRRALLVPIREIAKQQANEMVLKEAETLLARLDKIQAWAQNKPQLPAKATPEQIAAYDQQLQAHETLASEQFGEASQPVFEIWILQITSLQSQKEFEQALAISDKTLPTASSVFGADHPEVAATHFIRGDILRALTRVDEAKSEYQTADELNQKSGIAPVSTLFQTKLRLGQLAFERKDYPAALGFYTAYFAIRKQNAIAETGESGLAYNQLGVCQSHAKQYDQALASFQQAYAVLINHVPKDAPIIKTIGNNFEAVQAEAKKAAQAVEPPVTPPMSNPPTELAEQTKPQISRETNNESAAKAQEAAKSTTSCWTLGFNLFLGLVVSRIAWQRGYSSLYWFVAFWCSCTTPILTPCVLALLPNRREMRRREELTKWIAGEVSKVGARSSISTASPISGESVGDQRTQA